MFIKSNTTKYIHKYQRIRVSETKLPSSALKTYWYILVYTSIFLTLMMGILFRKYVSITI